MNTFTKVGIAGVIIGLVMWGAKAAQKTLSAFQFDVVGYGRPTLTGAMLTVPLQLRFKNPTSLPILIDRLYADVYLLKNNEFVQAARVNDPVNIPPGESNQWAYPVINIQNIFGGDVIATLTAVQQILASKKLTVRTKAIAVYKGITLPEQTFTNQIDIS